MTALKWLLIVVSVAYACALAVLFVAQAAGVEMSLGEQLGAMLVLMLSTKGVAGVPRAALVVLAGALIRCLCLSLGRYAAPCICAPQEML